MDPTLAATDFQDFGLLMISNGMEPASLADAGLQDFESCMRSDVMEPMLAEAGLQDFGLFMTSNAIEPALAAAAHQDTELCTISNKIEPTLAAAGRQSIVISTMSSTRPAGCGDWASKDDWTRARPLIKRLYVDEDRTLKNVMIIMEAEHGLKAT